jgi:hypothetical protein
MRQLVLYIPAMVDQPGQIWALDDRYIPARKRSLHPAD